MNFFFFFFALLVASAPLLVMDDSESNPSSDGSSGIVSVVADESSPGLAALSTSVFCFFVQANDSRLFVVGDFEVFSEPLSTALVSSLTGSGAFGHSLFSDGGLDLPMFGETLTGFGTLASIGAGSIERTSLFQNSSGAALL